MIQYLPIFILMASPLLLGAFSVVIVKKYLMKDADLVTQIEQI